MLFTFILRISCSNMHCVLCSKDKKWQVVAAWHDVFRTNTHASGFLSVWIWAGIVCTMYMYLSVDNLIHQRPQHKCRHSYSKQCEKERTLVRSVLLKWETNRIVLLNIFDQISLFKTHKSTKHYNLSPTVYYVLKSSSDSIQTFLCISL